MFIMNEQKMLPRSLLKEIILEQKEDFARFPRGTSRDQLHNLIEMATSPHIVIIQGVRRCGKSTLLAQLIDKLAPQSVHYLNFEDERLVSFKVSMFNILLEVFYEVNGQHNIFVFDEIQVVEGWERFVRRLHNSGKKIFVTGSNASLLSQELGTKLTGRHLDLELFPFSFQEFLCFKEYSFHQDDFYHIERRSQLHKYFNEYLYEGSMPVYLQTRQRGALSSLYEDIVIRDVIQRYQIDNIKLFRELTLYLASNSTSSITYSKLKQYFHLGSVNTVIKYLGYLENSYFLFIVNSFSPSYKKQLNTPKKIYIICNAFIDKIGFHLTENRGVLLENLVFLQLRRCFKQIYYYKTQNDLEVDFLTYDAPDNIYLIQVTWSISEVQIREREITALVKAMQETKTIQSWILTESETETITIDDKTIYVLPVYQWLLQKI
jgi:predicted AAA+ superfamily ATPase